jgi:hypothetical protein
MKTFLIFCSYADAPPTFIGNVEAESEVNVCQKLGIDPKFGIEKENGRKIYELADLHCSVFFAEELYLERTQNLR